MWFVESELTLISSYEIGIRNAWKDVCLALLLNLSSNANNGLNKRSQKERNMTREAIDHSVDACRSLSSYPTLYLNINWYQPLPDTRLHTHHTIYQISWMGIGRKRDKRFFKCQEGENLVSLPSDSKGDSAFDDIRRWVSERGCFMRRNTLFHVWIFDHTANNLLLAGRIIREWIFRFGFQLVRQILGRLPLFCFMLVVLEHRYVACEYELDRVVDTSFLSPVRAWPLITHYALHFLSSLRMCVSVLCVLAQNTNFPHSLNGWSSLVRVMPSSWSLILEKGNNNLSSQKVRDLTRLTMIMMHKDAKWTLNIISVRKNKNDAGIHQWSLCYSGIDTVLSP